ncbi:MAG: hypothetical protein KH345_13235 [Eubacterium sp.]|nr:hypothetical protein [Eubacterium sp.]
MAITFEAYARNNGAFKAARPMPTGSPAGIIIHSTGADNPNLKRYVNAPEICGENPYRNYFDRADSDVCPHAVVGKDKNGEVKATKLLPWNVCCWGCGNGSKGSYNYAPAYIQIEIAEDALLPDHKAGKHHQPQGGLRSWLRFQPRRPGALARQVREEHGLVPCDGRAGEAGQDHRRDLRRGKQGGRGFREAPGAWVLRKG